MPKNKFGGKKAKIITSIAMFYDLDEPLKFVREIFNILARCKKGAGGEIQLTDALAEHIKKRAGYACIYDGQYYDCGNKLEFIKAIINFGLQRREFKKPLRKYLKNI